MQELDQIKIIRKEIKDKPILNIYCENIQKYFEAIILEEKLTFLVSKYRRPVAEFLVRNKRFDKKTFMQYVDVNYTISRLILIKLLDNGIIISNGKKRITKYKTIY